MLFPPKRRFFGGHSSLTDGLAAYYAFDDDSSNKHIADSLGRAPCTLISSNNTEDITASGNNDDSLQFDGADYASMLNLLDVMDLSFASPFSINMWLKRTSALTGHKSLISTRDGVVNEGIAIIKENNLHDFYVLFYGGASNIQCRTSAGYIIPLNSWAMFTFTYDGSLAATGMNTYKNTVNSSSRTGTTVSAIGNTNTCLFMNDLGSFGKFIGCVQHVSLWSKELNTTEIADLYAGGAALLC